MRHFFSLRYLPLVLVLLCSACGTALPTVKPYKLDVQQGNVVTSKMLLQLRPGMTKSQVRFIMGTPLIQDSFHGNRWDYVYQLREKGKIVEQRRVILDFENELLKAVRGDVIPAGTGTTEGEKTNTGARTVQPVTKPKDKSLMDKLKFWKKDEVPPATVSPSDSDAGKQAEPQTQAQPASEPATTEPVIAPEPTADSPTESGSPESAPAASGESTPPAEEPKSLLSVPMEVPASDSPVPADTGSVNSAPAAPSDAPVEAAAPESPAPQESNAPPAESVPESTTTPAPDPLHYEPSSGMQFDRNLESGTEVAPVEAKPEVVKPTSPQPARAGNKNVPEPKDLPAEGEPDFFERMLEKIGF